MSRETTTDFAAGNVFTIIDDITDLKSVFADPPTRQRVVSHLIASQHPVTATDIARDAECTTETARKHLEKLVETGVAIDLDGEFERNEDHFDEIDHREDLRRYVANLDQLERMFEDKGDKEYVGTPTEDVDEDELDAEITELEAELDDE